MGLPGKLPKEIEDMKLGEQKTFLHNLREEAEVDYNEAYSEYRKQWRSLNLAFKQTFARVQSSQKDFVSFPGF